MNGHIETFTNHSLLTYQQLVHKKTGPLSVCDVAPYKHFRKICCLNSTLKTEAVSFSQYWHPDTTVYNVITQMTTSLICTSNLFRNSTLHNQQKYTPVTQTKLQQHWHH
jgi:hypothetical protein